MSTNLTITARGTAVSRLTNVDVYDWQGAKQQVVSDNQDGDLNRNANVISFKSNILDGLVAVKRQGSPIEWSWKKADATGRLLVNKPIVMIDFASPESYAKSGNTGPFALPPGGSVEVITSTGVKKVVKDRKPGKQFTNDFDDRANAISVPLEQGTSGQLVVRDAKGFVAARYSYTKVNAERSSISRVSTQVKGFMIRGTDQVKNWNNYLRGQMEWRVTNWHAGTTQKGSFTGRNAQGMVVGQEGEWQRAFQAVRVTANSYGYLEIVLHSINPDEPDLCLLFPVDRRVGPNRGAWGTYVDKQGREVAFTGGLSVAPADKYPGFTLTVSSGLSNGGRPKWSYRKRNI